MNVSRGYSYSAIVTSSLVGKYVYPLKVRESTFPFNAPISQRSPLWKGSHACPVVLSVKSNMPMRWALVERFWQGKTEVIGEKPCRRNTWSTLRLTWIIYKGSVRIAQKTLSFSVIKTGQLMLYSKIIAVCSQIHTKHINTLWGQNVEMLKVKHKVTTGLCRVQVASYLSDGRFATHFCDLWRQSQSLPYWCANDWSPDMCSHLTCPCYCKPSPRPPYSLQKSPYFTYVISHVRIRFIARDSPKRRPLHSV